MVLLVYACISPLVGFILAFCFVVLAGLYRHQFVYIYNPFPDSGGQLWIQFIRLILSCMLVAEITLAGVLALKKAAVAAPMMAPLIIATILFYMYVNQQHFRVANYLPSRLSLRQDLMNHRELDFDFLRDAYLQPEMRHQESKLLCTIFYEAKYNET